MKRIHLISFDVPLPANYGGVIDVFQHLKMLKALNYSVILHCFTKDNAVPDVLREYCDELFLYPRKSGIFQQLSVTPYIVKTRTHTALLTNLLKDNSPIFFEGIHSCGLLAHPKLTERVKIVRTHNIEADYYAALAKGSISLLTKIYFKLEALRLKQFEKKLKDASYILAVTEKDAIHFRVINKNAVVLHNTVEVDSYLHERNAVKTEIVFHGNLSVEENATAARWIATHIAPNISQNIIIAGKNPSSELISFLQQHYCTVIPSPSNEALSEILASAQIHLLPTFQVTGAKNKNLRSLCAGGFCLVNQAMMVSTNLHEFVIFAETPEEFICQIQKHLYAVQSYRYLDALKQKVDTSSGSKILQTVFTELGI